MIWKDINEFKKHHIQKGYSKDATIQEVLRSVRYILDTPEGKCIMDHAKEVTRVNKVFERITNIPDDEKVVSVGSYGGFSYWDFKYPFKHVVDPVYLVATDKSVYQIKNL